MGKRKINHLAESTVNQINSTLDMLQQKHLSVTYNLVNTPDYTNTQCQITWNSHISSRNNCGSSFTKLDQYLFILKNNSYHSLLFDGSLIRANFKFENNILLSQNLLWWPSPYNYSELLQDGFSPLDIMENFYSDSKWFETIKMRSPIRVDYDFNLNTVTHPKSHMHIQHENTRLSIDSPICFNRFVDFIFRNFYAEFDLKFSSFDFLEYKTHPLEDIAYLPSKITI